MNLVLTKRYLIIIGEPKTFPTSSGGMKPLTVLLTNQSRGCMVRQSEPCAETPGQGSSRIPGFLPAKWPSGQTCSTVTCLQCEVNHTSQNIGIYQHKARCKSSVFVLPPNSLAAPITQGE